MYTFHLLASLHLLDRTLYTYSHPAVASFVKAVYRQLIPLAVSCTKSEIKRKSYVACFV